MLAELIDNALRYSPPIAPVRVSAVHTSNAGVLIEIHDDGIGMTDGDLRIANMRLEAGGEATPDNARHMGLFVVSRLSDMHGMVVRLRNTVAGQPSSGTTAELYVPAGLLEHASPIGADARPFSEPGPEPEPASDQPRWFAVGEPAAAHDHPSDTSSFFGSRSRVEEALQDSVDLSDSDELAADLAAPGTDDADTDLIYQRMLSEFLVDPHKLAVPQDWKSVWDSGWTAAAEVDDVPVAAHTDHGLPVRQPGARLVPGAAESMAAPRNGGGGQRRSSAGAGPGTRASTARSRRGPGVPRRQDRTPMTSPPRPQPSSLDWLLSNFAREVPGVSHAVLVSVDGLLLAASEKLPKERGDQLAAVTSGLASLAHGAAQLFDGGRVLQSVVEMDRGLPVADAGR